MKLKAYWSQRTLRFTIRIICLPLALAFFQPRVSQAEYGPLLVRVIPSIAARACKEAAFSQSEAIIQALQSQQPAEVASVLEGSLKQFRATLRNAPNYPARAFCIHQLVPYALPASGPIPGRALRITDDVKRYQALGIIYKYYGPDDLWKLRKGPVDLNDLANNYLTSVWGQQAFLMMTLMGWSQGACQEGPDQFREVIKRGEEFLRSYPNSGVSSDIRLEIAEAYTTWWALSRSDGDETVDHSKYQAGANQARTKAIAMFRQNLNERPARRNEILKRLAALDQQNVKALPYQYYCGDYED